MDRYLHAIYCDDIRLEVGNKQSLMGIYAADLFVAGYPTVLPKLCVVINLVTPVDRPFTTLTLKVTKDDETLIEAAMSEDQLHHPQMMIIENGDKENLERRIGLTASFVIAPFAVDKECTLRVQAETEDGLLKGSGLRIKAVIPIDGAAQATIG